MNKHSSAQRTAYVHVGTHKTGTTSIQALLAMNDDAFREAGVFIPQTGRIAPESAGHHNIAWELVGYPQFKPAFGSLETLLREVAAENAPTVCLSSEEFEYSHVDAAALQHLRDGFLAIGYQPKIIVYLRPQCDYLESLYAEACREGNIEFAYFLNTIAVTGSYGSLRFDYQLLTNAFAEVFGAENTIVHAYRSSAPAAVLLREFTGIIAADSLVFSGLALPGRLNPMVSFPNVIAARERHLECTAHHSMMAAQRFDPLSLLDILRMAARFAHANEEVRRTFGVRIGYVTPGMLARELITEIFRDRDSRYRKRLIRALVESEIEIAA
jgi:hypothetical protein